MKLDDFAERVGADYAHRAPKPSAPVRCEICLKLGIGNGALADLGDCPICYRYTRLNSNGTCGREYCSRLWTRAKRQAEPNDE